MPERQTIPTCEWCGYTAVVETMIAWHLCKVHDLCEDPES